MKRYGTEIALRGLDLEIRDGEFFCLLGPSGCGKTTTLNLIGGFVPLTEGEIWIQGRRIDQLEAMVAKLAEHVRALRDAGQGPINERPPHY